MKYFSRLLTLANSFLHILFAIKCVISKSKCDIVRLESSFMLVAKAKRSIKTIMCLKAKTNKPV